MGQLAVDHVQIGAAHCAGVHPHAHLTRPRLGLGALDQLERLAGFRQQHRAHDHLPSCRESTPPEGKPSVDGFRYGVAIALVCTLPPTLLFWPIVHGWIGLWRRLGALFEGRELHARFGDAYERYGREVPRCVPRLRRTH